MADADKNCSLKIALKLCIDSLWECFFADWLALFLYFFIKGT